MLGRYGFAALLAFGAAGCLPGVGEPAPELPAPTGEVRVTLLQTTDIHHHAKGAGHAASAPSASGSYARIAAYVAQVRSSAGHPVLLVDSGDWTMGTVYDLTLADRPLALRFLDALRYDCVTLGNHEFDGAPAGLAGMLRAARQSFGFRTPIVASNLDLAGNADLAPWVGPGKAIQRTRVETLANGLRVGYLGLMGRDAASVAPAAAPVRFTDYGRNPALVQALVDDLRGRRRCRLVIALDHAGTDPAGTAGEDVDLARRVRGIDVIASGHAHHPLASVRTVANGSWNTLICCAGAFGSHVSRLDLLCRPASGTLLEAAENRPMTDASLGELGSGVVADPAVTALLVATDRDLNRALAPIFREVARFPDYDPGDPARGLFHPVAGSAQALAANDRFAVPCPSGLGNLCADAMRAVANGILARGSGRPDFDPTPVTVGMAATGVIRGTLEQGWGITFADLYGILPLGRTPDAGQAGLTGEPLISVYLDATGLRVLCAMQLLAQAGLTPTDDYLNLSGLSYGLNPEPTRAFFAAASAAAALALTEQRAEAGSARAAQARAALAARSVDQGAALLAATAAGNPFAGALVGLGAPDPGPERIQANLALLAQVAAAAGRQELDALLMAKAVAAIGPVSAFAPGDPACTGPAAPVGSGRQRVVLDLYALRMVAGTQARFGTLAAVYQGPQGDRQLSAATPEGLKAILANRLERDPGGPFQELKAWMALLLYLTTPPAQGGHFAGGWITDEYRSGADFTRFPAFGAAVRIRNPAYPLDGLRALAALVQGLRSEP